MKKAAAALALLAFCPAPAAAAPSAEARALVDEAIAELRTHHIQRGRMDWDRLAREAYEIADNAVTPRDAHPAIEHVIAALGERHTMFLPARTAPAPVPDAATPPRPRPAPESPKVERRAGGIGYVRMPGWPFARDDPRSEAWIEQARASMAAADRAGICGWIIDVRGNGGGNVWPMFDVLAPILGTPPFGSFVAQSRVPILYAGGRAFYPGIQPVMPPLPALNLRSAEGPAAVLMDEGTGSSGENVVMAFKGRERTRFFGTPTANYVSVNNPKTLADGSVITTTIGFTEDRTGRAWLSAIEPDEAVEAAQAEQAAATWLPRQGCGRAKD